MKTPGVVSHQGVCFDREINFVILTKKSKHWPVRYNTGGYFILLFDAIRGNEGSNEVSLC